jgi:hypothetical protein
MQLERTMPKKFSNAALPALVAPLVRNRCAVASKGEFRAAPAIRSQFPVCKQSTSHRIVAR